MITMPRLLARKSAEPMTTTEPEPSEAHQLAAAVRRPGRHQLLERQLSALRAKSVELRQQVVDLRDATNGANAAAIDRQIKALVAELDANDAGIRECRGELAPHRLEHAARVERELRPMRQAAAQTVAAAIDALRLALGEYNTVTDALRMHGVDAPSIRVRELHGLDDELRGII